MFLHLSVILLTGGGMRGCSGGRGVGGRAWLLRGGGGACVGYDEIRRYGPWAGGTHPTGMHSCFIYFFLKLVSHLPGVCSMHLHSPHLSLLCLQRLKKSVTTTWKLNVWNKSSAIGTLMGRLNSASQRRHGDGTARRGGIDVTCKQILTLTAQFTKPLTSRLTGVPWVWLVLFHCSTEWEPPYRTLSRDHSVRCRQSGGFVNCTVKKLAKWNIV